MEKYKFMDTAVLNGDAAVTAQSWLTISLTVVMALITAIQAYTAIKMRKMSEMARIHDTTLLYFNKYLNLVQGNDNTKDYWDRYWHLQQEQFIFWHKGYIDPSIFAVWMYYRAKDYEDKSYRDNFWSVSEDLMKDFKIFIVKVFNRENDWKGYKKIPIEDIWNSEEFLKAGLSYQNHDPV
jgi:hypothetical protein